jgi:hypothetical protein
MEMIWLTTLYYFKTNRNLRSQCCQLWQVNIHISHGNSYIEQANLCLLLVFMAAQLGVGSLISLSCRHSTHAPLFWMHFMKLYMVTPLLLQDSRFVIVSRTCHTQTSPFFFIKPSDLASYNFVNYYYYYFT